MVLVLILRGLFRLKRTYKELKPGSLARLFSVEVSLKRTYKELKRRGFVCVLDVGGV